MINILKNGLKHICIFYVTNILACFIIGAYLSAYREVTKHSVLYVFQGIIEGAFLAIPLSFFAVFFTFLPYLVFITIIKLCKAKSLVVYSLFGSLTAFPLYMGALKDISNNIGVLSLFVITGAICGYVYGTMDLNHPSPNHKKDLLAPSVNAGEGHD